MADISSKKYQKEAEEYEKFIKRINSLAQQNEKTTQEVLLEYRKKGASDYSTLMEQEFNELKINHTRGTVSNDEYYKELAVLRDAYFNEGTNEWTRYTLEIIDYNKKVIDEQSEQIKKFLETVKKVDDTSLEYYNSAISNLLKKQDDVEKKLLNISKVANKVTIGSGENAYSWLQLSDIDQEINALKNYNDSLIRVKERINNIVDGFSIDKKDKEKIKSSFFSQITSLDVPQATGFSNYLMALPKERLSDYLGKWGEKLSLAELIPQNIYNDEMNTVLDNYAIQMEKGFSKSLEEKFGEIPTSFFENGASSANSFKEGFLGAIDTVMKELSTEISKRVSGLSTQIVLNPATQTNNYSSYNIYGSSEPQQTALEIYKQDAKKRMLTGE